MPYSTLYTKTITHSIANGINSFSRTIPFTVTGSGNERRTINETIPSGASQTGLNVTFYTASGAFLGFSSTGPLTLSGKDWNYTIPLSSSNNNTSFFVRTGNSLYINTDDLGIKDISGTLYVWNTGTTAATRPLTIEMLIDASPGVGGTDIAPA